ncbi:MULTISPECIES: hypothetical protein [Streptomyces]|uniref:hypothetical protein n=1 Tax=Streptomyces TaxID=1883 RepID=UPI00345C130A
MTAIASWSIQEARTTLGMDAPDCEECDGEGRVLYCEGPHLRERECDECLGRGTVMPCPPCQTTPNDDCETCDGHGILA